MTQAEKDAIKRYSLAAAIAARYEVGLAQRIDKSDRMTRLEDRVEDELDAADTALQATVR